MNGSTLCEDVWLPSASGRQTAVSTLCRHHHPRTRASAINHALDLLFAHFSIFKYPGNTRKIHGRKIKQKVEVNLTRKSVDNKKLGVREEGLNRFGGNQVVAVICTTKYRAFSCLQIMSMSVRETAQREMIVQLEWVYRYERLFFDWCSMSEETRRPLLDHPQRRRRPRMTWRWRLRRGT